MKWEELPFTQEDVKAQLQRLEPHLTEAQFGFLEHLVTLLLEDRPARHFRFRRLAETYFGVSIESPLARRHAGDIRKRLRAYYQTDAGESDYLRIDIPDGTLKPLIEVNQIELPELSEDAFAVIEQAKDLLQEPSLHTFLDAIDALTTFTTYEAPHPLVYGFLAEVYCASLFFTHAPLREMGKAEQAIARVPVNLRPHLPSVCLAQALIEGLRDWRWETALALARHAHALSQGVALNSVIYQHLMQCTGHTPDLIDALYARSQISPEPALLMRIAALLTVTGEYAEAERILTRLLERGPKDGLFALLSDVYEARGDWQEAINTAHRIKDRDWRIQRETRLWGVHAATYRMPSVNATDLYAQRRKEVEAGAPYTALYVAECAFNACEYDHALWFLTRALEVDHDSDTLTINTHPYWRHWLTHVPGFRELVEGKLRLTLRYPEP